MADDRCPHGRSHCEQNETKLTAALMQADEEREKRYKAEDALDDLRQEFDKLAAVQSPNFVDFPAGVAMPLMLESVHEKVLRSDRTTRAFVYMFEQQEDLGKFVRKQNGIADEEQKVSISVSVAAQMPVEGLRAGQMYTVRLNEYEPPVDYDPPGEMGLIQMMQGLFGRENIVFIGGRDKVITEAECTRCHERFVVTGGEDDPEHPEHYTREDGTECGGIGAIIGEWRTNG